jgi:hypothetical protein
MSGSEARWMFEPSPPRAVRLGRGRDCRRTKATPDRRAPPGRSAYGRRAAPSRRRRDGESLGRARPDQKPSARRGRTFGIVPLHPRIRLARGNDPRSRPAPRIDDRKQTPHSPEKPEPVFAEAVAELGLNPSIGVEESRQYIGRAESPKPRSCRQRSLFKITPPGPTAPLRCRRPRSPA